jgi:hypothetical protein
MSRATFLPDPSHRSQEYYAIRIKGHLSPAWSEAFDGMKLTKMRGGDTLIRGAVADQAALHGLLARIRDLNLTLISVARVKPERTARQHRKQRADALSGAQGVAPWPFPTTPRSVSSVPVERALPYEPDDPVSSSA